ncbi:hypothetical protein [Stenotrophomonas maltophilia]|uniref:Uncharacterized protein n=1 Tax=Stenotrophomonas maltophilia (strain R551-3) TaxID=391008 RepID=B4SMU2_STRM5|nr:hypothetical protein [Stenotrophomonas maltophilia]ACF53551.1 hypothetical protein Smal_3852 [Stenotrophomonas maltophilia R551-3]
MKTEFLSEYYDGLIQGVLSDDGRLFYSFCVHADFSDVSQDRLYWVIPIDDVEDQQLRNCLLQGGEGALDAFLRATFLDRHGMVLEGNPESWSGTELRFEPRGDAHASFLRYPSVDVLAGVSARHTSAATTRK